MKKNHKELIDKLMKGNDKIKSYFYDERGTYPDFLEFYIDGDSHFALSETMRISTLIENLEMSYMITVSGWNDLDGYLDKLSDYKHKLERLETT